MADTDHPAPTYTDGTEVRVGDRIRYHQQFGGLMSPDSINGDYWNYGTAVQAKRSIPGWSDIEMVVEYGPYAGRRAMIEHHVIERWVPDMRPYN